MLSMCGLGCVSRCRLPARPGLRPRIARRGCGCRGDLCLLCGHPCTHGAAAERDEQATSWGRSSAGGQGAGEQAVALGPPALLAPVSGEVIHEDPGHALHLQLDRTWTIEPLAIA